LDRAWLFGGRNIDGLGNYTTTNDLWRFNGTNWTWVSGTSVHTPSGRYGTKGTAAASNAPGARFMPYIWYSSGSVWMFGGNGLDASGTLGWLNDLWKYDGTNWTWVTGSNSTSGQGATWGTKGTPASSNVINGRGRGASWRDSSGNLWVFGGWGAQTSGNGAQNDLWKYDGSNWTWMTGSSSVNQTGVWGTLGVASSSTTPSARYEVNATSDGSGNGILFGGIGYDGSTQSGHLNDLWKFDGTSWTWLSGSSARNQSGVYGTKGTASSSNVPGGRYAPVVWASSTDVWIFGGYG